MFRSLTHPGVSLSPHRARSLVLGTLTACLTLGTMLAAPMPGLGQSSEPTDEVNLNATPTVVNGRISRPTLQPGSQGEAVIELQSVLMLLGYYSGPLSGVYQDNTQIAVRQFQTDAGIAPDGIVGPATWSTLFPVSPAEANPPGTAASNPSTPAPSNAPGKPASPSPTPSQATNGTTTAASTTTTDTPAASPTPAASGATGSTARPVLRLGDRGDAVRQLQQKLQSLGFYDGAIDGIFGTQTENAVKEMQTSNSLTVDGIVGPATWNALN